MYADDTALSSTIDSFNEDRNKNITSEINNPKLANGSKLTNYR